VAQPESAKTSVAITTAPRRAISTADGLDTFRPKSTPSAANHGAARPGYLMDGGAVAVGCTIDSDDLPDHRPQHIDRHRSGLLADHRKRNGIRRPTASGQPVDGQLLAVSEADP